jgi:two-component system cell cycle response regulator DivK
VVVRAASDDGNYVVSVTDSGPGIAPEDQGKIFEEFQQVDNSNTRKKGGTGLGLAIARRIIEMHGGRLWVESKLGHGSTFWFSVPIRVAPPSQRERSRGPTKGSGLMSKRILAIDDQEDNRRILRDLLAAVDYEVLEAMDGEDAVAQAEKHVPDLILMDIQLPGIDGYEATRRIKTNPLLKHIPVIAVTSYALTGDEDKAMEAGCDAYIAKPYSPRALLAKVREFLK